MSTHRVSQEFFCGDATVWCTLEDCMGGYMLSLASSVTARVTCFVSVVDARTWIDLVPLVSSILLELKEKGIGV